MIIVYTIWIGWKSWCACDRPPSLYMVFVLSLIISWTPLTVRTSITLEQNITYQVIKLTNDDDDDCICTTTFTIDDDDDDVLTTVWRRRLTTTTDDDDWRFDDDDDWRLTTTCFFYDWRATIDDDDDDVWRRSDDDDRRRRRRTRRSTTTTTIDGWLWRSNQTLLLLKVQFTHTLAVPVLLNAWIAYKRQHMMRILFGCSPAKKKRSITCRLSTYQSC